jgi:uncharacterized membrane protein YqiK
LGFIFGLIVIAALYKKASKEISFVRTGMGGQKVIMNGGSIIVPVVHEIIPVNMNTLRLEVQRGAEAALITRDRMRVDVKAEFYVRVKPTHEAIADAAQTLGRKTMNPTALKELVEGKFVDALRAVAAGMAMEELHENRVEFVQKVQQAVAEDLLKNGMELETVSLTALDQTDQTFFNPQNAFDAQGLTKLTEEIQARRKQRNDIEQDTEVQIRKKNLEAEQFKLALARDEEYAKLSQQREIAVRSAEEDTATQKEQAEKHRQAEEAQIASRQRVDQAGILAERAVEEERIEKERLLKERDIARHRSIETAEIERKKAVELSDQDRAIAIADKSKEKSVAEAEADRARALAVRAQEQVITSRETEIAERQKAIELVEARKLAERDAIGIQVAAEAEKLAALDQADAIRTVATGNADKVTIGANAEASAEIARANAAERRYAVDAEGKRALHEAENILDAAIIQMRIKLATIENLDRIIRESVKPMEAIDNIKIIHVDGLTGAGGGHGGNGNGGAPGSGGGNLADQVVNSALRYRGQAPLVDALLKDIGLDGTSLNGLTTPLHEKDNDKPSTNAPGPAKPKA